MRDSSQWKSTAYRTHTIGQIVENGSELLGKEVIIAGYAETIRGRGAICFLMLRDGTGIIQAFLKKDNMDEEIYIEVKNVTLSLKKGIAEFPDAVTSRGTKHLQKLKESIKKGYKPYVLFLTQIQGINNFRIAKDIDSTYYKEYLDAKKSGVSFLAYRCSLNSKEIKIEKKIKIIDE